MFASIRKRSTARGFGASLVASLAIVAGASVAGAAPQAVFLASHLVSPPRIAGNVFNVPQIGGFVGVPSAELALLAGQRRSLRAQTQRSSLGVLSFNLMQTLVSARPELPDHPVIPLLPLDSDPNDGCSFLRPENCAVFDALRPGGNGSFGRRDFTDAGGIYLPDAGLSPGDGDWEALLREHGANQQLFGTVCSDPARCNQLSSAVPEPSAALLFAAGFTGVWAQARRRRRRTGTFV